MTDANLLLFERTARLLEPVLDELVFLGGCATSLLMTDAAAAGIRATQDIDALVEASSYAEYNALADRLRALDLTEDSRDGAPICRWRHGDLTIDVMPTDERILGFSNQWYQPAIRFAERKTLGSLVVRLVTPAYFIATKLEAFHGRGRSDSASSHDLEDLIAVVDGRPELTDEIHAATPAVRDYISAEIALLLRDRGFVDALHGPLLPDTSSEARRPIVEQRLRRIAAAPAH